MGNTLWFITILQEKPWLGIIIGLCFFAFMFLSKNLIVYLYSRNKAKKEQEKEMQAQTSVRKNDQ
jgi:flagellar biosynthesis component FlhA